MAPWSRFCDWCGVHMGYDEALSSEKTVSYGGEPEILVTYNLCYYCREFPTPESVDYWKTIIVKWAILGYSVRLKNITYTPPDVYIEYIIQYKDENPLVRMGWVA